MHLKNNQYDSQHDGKHGENHRKKVFPDKIVICFAFASQQQLGNIHFGIGGCKFYRERGAAAVFRNRYDAINRWQHFIPAGVAAAEIYVCAVAINEAVVDKNLGGIPLCLKDQAFFAANRRGKRSSEFRPPVVFGSDGDSFNCMQFFRFKRKGFRHISAGFYIDSKKGKNETEQKRSRSDYIFFIPILSFCAFRLFYKRSPSSACHYTIRSLFLTIRILTSALLTLPIEYVTIDLLVLYFIFFNSGRCSYGRYQKIRNFQSHTVCCSFFTFSGVIHFLPNFQGRLRRRISENRLSYFLYIRISMVFGHLLLFQEIYFRRKAPRCTFRLYFGFFNL